MKLLVALASFSILLAGCAAPGERRAATIAPAPGVQVAGPALGMPLPLNAADLNFVNQAGFSGQAEVVLGRIAQQQGGSPAVRSFGAQMVGDHTQANQELASIAASQGATAPTQPDAGRQAVAAAIGAAAGPAFDAQYIPLQLADHDAAVALFQDEATTSTNESLRAYARKYLPVIQRHETMLRSMGTHVAALP